MTRLLGLCVVRLACFERTFVLRKIRCLRMGCEGLPFPDQLTVGPWCGDRGQGELSQGGVGGLGMPLFLGTGQRGVPGFAGAPWGAPPVLTADICSRSFLPLGPLPPALTLSPASSASPLKSLDFESPDTQGAFVPGFPGLSLCTSDRSPHLVFTHTSFAFSSSLIHDGNLKLCARY